MGFFYILKYDFYQNKKIPDKFLIPYPFLIISNFFLSSKFKTLSISFLKAFFVL